MKQILIEGGHILRGEIKVSGAKNSAVALVPASLLSDEVITIDNIPNISDIDALNDILTYLGAKVTREKEMMRIDATGISNRKIPEQISKKLRASYYFMGALLGKYRHVEMYFPGGCAIGTRPINLHLKAFELLGATIEEKDNLFIIHADRLKGNHIYFDFPSVGATINVLLAACKAEGKTVLENAAKEPEIVSVATFLNNMGAKITGAGTSTITIHGVQKLGRCFMEVIPDRIEAGTYIIAGALVGDKLRITNLIPEHIEALLSKLKEMHCPLKIGEDYVEISASNDIKATNIKTQGYPGFPTDLQQPITTLLTQAHGKSVLEETIYENRFQNVPYLNNMKADITIDNRKIYVKGPTKLSGQVVKATDLRAGACLILAGLKAEGKTVVTEVEHVLRGYENIIEKLENVGAKITLEEI